MILVFQSLCIKYVFPEKLRLLLLNFDLLPAQGMEITKWPLRGVGELLYTAVNGRVKPAYNGTAKGCEYFFLPFAGAFCLTFRHRASSILDRHFATLQRTLFIYLINKYISLSDICLTVHHRYK